MSRGDILFLYTDGVYDGSDDHDRRQIERIIGERKYQSSREISAAILDHAVERDKLLLQDNQPELVDDKTAFIIKRT